VRSIFRGGWWRCTSRRIDERQKCDESSKQASSNKAYTYSIYPDVMPSHLIIANQYQSLPEVEEGVVGRIYLVSILFAPNV
jgi:hypothetical protein